MRHSRNTEKRIQSLHSRTVLTDDALRAVAPSIFATQPMVGVSDRYSFLPTSEIVGAMRKNGWTPVHAEQQRVRTFERQNFQRHMIRFWRTDQIAVKGEYMPEVCVINSHDRSSAWTLPVGLYRFTCSNGMMVADSTLEPMKVRHSGCEIQEVINASMLILEKLPGVTNTVERMQSRQLVPSESAGFARDSLLLRYDDLKTAPVEPSALLQTRRNEDSGNSLWMTFNRVQENLTLGKAQQYGRFGDDGKRIPRMRAVLGLTQNVTLNKQLWELATAYLN